MTFRFSKLNLDGLMLIEPSLLHDERGFFMETYKNSDFSKNGIDQRFVQNNHSVSRKNVLRGLHFQKDPKAQGKLIRVIQGAVYDVAVDIRKSSSTFQKWFSIELNEINNYMIYIPPGFAHGFLALTDNVHLVYSCTQEYDVNSDTGIRWNDMSLNIKWPISDPIISIKDRGLPLLHDAILF